MIASILKGLIVVLILSAAGLYFLFCPSYLSQVNFNGKVIKIDRDDHGIATLHVSSIEEMLYAMGNIYAEDRLFQMSLRAYSA
jgi:acyl-homoserine lactone acylase PvdQ